LFDSLFFAPRNQSNHHVKNEPAGRPLLHLRTLTEDTTSPPIPLYPELLCPQRPAMREMRGELDNRWVHKSLNLSPLLRETCIIHYAREFSCQPRGRMLRLIFPQYLWPDPITLSRKRNPTSLSLSFTHSFSFSLFHCLNLFYSSLPYLSLSFFFYSTWTQYHTNILSRMGKLILF